MATTIFLKPTAVSQSTGASEITWNLDAAPYNVDTSSCSSTALTSYNGKLTGLLIYSGWDTSMVPSNNNLDATFVDSFSVHSQETDPQGMTFNNDGTKMFLVGKADDGVKEYALSSAFDISTASYTNRVGIGDVSMGSSAKSMSVQFNADGTKMFVLDLANERVNEYTLSTGFDVTSTVAYIDSFSVTPQEEKPTGLAFNTDGTKMFVCGWKQDKVFEYTLTTGFDVSTASFVDGFSCKTQNDDVREVRFNTDGTVMFVMGRQGLNDAVYRYTLTTGFDVSTATFEDFYSVGDQETAGTGIAFSTDGMKMFVVGSANLSYVYEYALNTAFDFSPVTTVIDGIEVKVYSNKKSRIVDSTIQLAQAGTVIGTNKAVATSGNIHTYGTSTNKWGTTITYTDLSTLQVALKYGSGAQPHTDNVYVYSIQLKVHYT